MSNLQLPWDTASERWFVRLAGVAAADPRKARALRYGSPRPVLAGARKPLDSGFVDSRRLALG
ncbi:MAG: hypothetical protein FJW26_05175 [Acidimicrobiia bacterium]|nr:hypothetical protein [Acidimicrobiia bacterium]